MSKRTHGQTLLDDFIKKLGKSLDVTQKEGVVDLDKLTPAWEARDKLEAYLSTPQRDSTGKFLPTPTTPSSNTEELEQLVSKICEIVGLNPINLTPTEVDLINTLITTTVEKATQEARENERYLFLEEMVAKTDKEYNHTEVDNWIFTLGNHMRNRWLTLKRLKANHRGES